MSQQNFVSFQIPDTEMMEIKTAITILRSRLQPYLKSLSAEERHDLPKMGDKTVSFVKKALEYCTLNSEIVPAFLDVNAFKVDVQAVESIRAICQPLEQITEALNDTMLLSGSEAYSSALIFYNAAKSAAKTNITGAKSVVEDLSSRFPGRSKGSAASVSAGGK